MNITKIQSLGAFLMACAVAGSAAAQPLTVYSYRHYEADEKLFDQFTSETGIPVNVVKAKAGTLVERLKAEGSQTPADVLITADVARLQIAKDDGLLRPVESETLVSRIPAHLRDPDNHWFGFTKRARVIVYEPSRVDAAELSTYEDLADPKWRGRIVVRSSSNVYNQSLLASIIAHRGEASAFEWARGIRRNMARAPQGSDRDQMRAVAKGLADCAIVNTYYVGLMQNSSDPKDQAVGNQLEIFFPNQNGRGTHINVSGAGVTRHSDNPAAAVAFLEFLASDQAQASFPAATSEYPVVDGVPWSDQQIAWGTFKEDTVPLSQLGTHNAEAIRIFNRAGWE